MSGLQRLRTPFFVAALIAVLLAVAAEIGLSLVPPELAAGVDEVGGTVATVAAELGVDADAAVRASSSQGGETPPGLGVPYLALVHGLLLFSLVMLGLPLVVTQQVHGRIQGIITVVVAIVVIVVGIAAIWAAVALLQLMVSLLLSPPWGTIAYMALFADFDTGTASAVMAAVMTLAYGAAILLVLAHQRFVTNLSLVLQFATSVIAVIVVTILHGWVPGFLVSITDAIAAIVVGIIAVIWAVVFLIGGIIALVKLLTP